MHFTRQIDLETRKNCPLQAFFAESLRINSYNMQRALVWTDREPPIGPSWDCSEAVAATQFLELSAFYRPGS